MTQTVAVIDLGSNSIRMNIYKLSDNGKYSLLDRRREMVRLYEGMTYDGILKSAPIDRTLKALAQFRTVIDEYRAESVLAVATAAVRAAHNRDVFLNQAYEGTGIVFDILTGEDEAYYDYLGVLNAAKVTNGVIIDVGGGSTEIIWVKDTAMVKHISLPYGAVTLTERFKSQPQSLTYRFFSQQLGTIDWIDEINRLNIYAIGGSARVLATHYRKSFSDDKTMCVDLTFKHVNEFYMRLVSMPVESRRHIPSVGPERADIILGGITPMKALMDMIGSDRFTVCSNGLREGIFQRFRKENCHEA